MDEWKVDTIIPATGRTEWIDRVRVLLTILVIAVHAGVTYGSEGGWYYQQPTDSLMVIVPCGSHGLCSSLRLASSPIV